MSANVLYDDDPRFWAERFVALLLALSSFGHITDAYPLELRPVLQEIASLRSATLDTLKTLRQQYSQEVKHEGKQLFTSIKTIFPFISF